MKTSFMSNLSVASAMRSTINSVQADMIKSQREVVSGKYDDIGQELGGTTSRGLNLQREMDMMNNLISTNSVVTQRLSSSQTGLQTMSDAAQQGLNTLVALHGSTDKTQLTTAVQTMTDVLDQFTDAANTSINGEYVFGGINTDTKPIADYKTDENGAKTAFDTAFSSYFGFPQTDTANTITITAPQMQDFMDTVVKPMFDSTGTDWNTYWSTASDTPMSSRISKTEVVQTSSTANSDGFRDMALASVIGVELLNANLTGEARNVVSDTAIDYMGKAIYGLDSDRSQLGLSESRVSQADDTLKAQVDIVKLNLDDLEGVDVYEASTRITSLKNQMEISYNLTSQLNKLSLVNDL
jgi:flagellar hook-associated protein 3 FlgL